MNIPNIIEKSKYNGYLCKKCNSIPIIQIIPKENNTKILSACKCHKQYENIEIFIKNKSLKNEIDINAISKDPINKIEDDINVDINSIKFKFDKAKKDLYENSDDLKNKIIKLFEEKIKEVNDIYEKYIGRNKIIINVIEQIIKSYELIKDNPSNIQNLLNNCIFDNRFRISSLLETFKNSVDDILKKLRNYFKEELIISNSICSKSIKKEKLANNFYCTINNFIEIDEDICAWCSKYKSYITVMNPNKKDSFNLNYIAHIRYVNCITKSNTNNIISCGDDGFIKIWPIINEDFINKQFKKGGVETSKIIDINLTPLLTFTNENKDLKKIEKMINIKDGQFLAHSPKTIFLFKYIIKENTSELNLANLYEYTLTPERKLSYSFLNDIIDIVPIEKDKKEIIALCMKSYIHFLSLPNFEVISTINVKSMRKNSLIQINPSEILIVDNVYYLKIIDLKNWKTKLTNKKSSSINQLLKLNDETIIYAGYEGIKRCMMKTMENLPDIIQLVDDNDDYYYDQYYRDDIVCLSQLKNGTIIACFQNGTIQSFKLYI